MMVLIETRLDPRSPEFEQNVAHNRALVATLRERLTRVQRGDDEAVKRHLQRGKLLARERINRLLDPGTPFLELSPLAAWGIYNDEAPSAGHRRRASAWSKAARSRSSRTTPRSRGVRTTR